MSKSHVAGGAARRSRVVARRENINPLADIHSPPQRLGKYPILGQLGKGAMGVVYKSFDPDIRRAVALKTIRKELLSDEDGAAAVSARFRHEAQAAGRLLHPGIVTVYEY